MSPELTPCSHLFLQFQYLCRRRLFGYRGIVRVSRLWCHSGPGYDPYSIPHRHQGAKDLDFGCKRSIPELPNAWLEN